jgi:hypothetical protein
VKLNEISVFIDPAMSHFLRNGLFNQESVQDIDRGHGPYFCVKKLLSQVQVT